MLGAPGPNSDRNPQPGDTPGAAPRSFEIPSVLKLPLAQRPRHELDQIFGKLVAAVKEDASIIAAFADELEKIRQTFNIEAPLRLAQELCPSFDQLFGCPNPARATRMEVSAFCRLLPSLGLPLDRLFVINFSGSNEPTVIEGEIKRETWSKLMPLPGTEVWSAEVSLGKGSEKYVTWILDNVFLYDAKKIARDSDVPFAIIDSPDSGSSSLLARAKQLLQHRNKWSLAEYHELFGEKRLIDTGLNLLAIRLRPESGPRMSEHEPVNSALSILAPNSGLLPQLRDEPNGLAGLALGVAVTHHYANLLTARAELQRLVAADEPLLAVAGFYDFVGFHLFAGRNFPDSKDAMACGESFASRLILSGLFEAGIKSDHDIINYIESDSNPAAMAGRAMKAIENLLALDFKPE